ncbi:MAG TPA: DUF4440 domain-containing protein [Sphingomicrobium sp.]|nr:DUF4440 domain-containing protein [Sphingomicrobium sp.]
MNKFILISAGVVLAVSLTACERSATPAQGNASGAASASAADTGAVEQSVAAFLGAFATKDYATAKSYYAPDATMVIPEMAPMKGIAAISADYDKFAADPAGKFVPTNESTVVSSGGDLAYSTGTYEVTYTNSKSKTVESGKGYYLLVHKKQADGSWKVVQDVSTPTED